MSIFAVSAITMASLARYLLLLALATDSMAQYVYEEPLLYANFPDGFVWGVATSAYQIEGGWNADGKGPNIWDTFTSIEGNINDGTDGKVACDSYNKYEEDARIISELGVSSYRFSISWARILPEGIGAENPAGIQYYKNLIAALKARGITPVATIYHWDLPQALQDQGGWLNETSAFWFEEYARVCFREFGDEVKQWITLNEPWVTSVNGHGEGTHAPGMKGIGDLVYTVSHNLLRAHAKAYRVYESEFKPSQGGECGITLNVGWSEPENPDDAAYREASENHIQFALGWFAHPIFKDGQYPPVMREKVDAKSAAQGFPVSRLPDFTAEERAELLGSSDFLGINFYTSDLCYPSPGDVSDVSYYADQDVACYQDKTWYPSGSSWLYVTPFGLRKIMNWVKNEYGVSIPVYITENGFSDKQGNLDDQHRTYYYKHYINQLLKATITDGCNVKGYFAWSLMDNFEWAEGYAEHFGIHSVDMEDANRARTPKASAALIRSIATNNGFNEDEINRLG
jgi:beta-glucosidase/6-phospho-beta-glucosidase/beta-galactosidase